MGESKPRFRIFNCRSDQPSCFCFFNAIEQCIRTKLCSRCEQIKSKGTSNYSRGPKNLHGSLVEPHETPSDNEPQALRDVCVVHIYVPAKISARVEELPLLPQMHEEFFNKERIALSAVVEELHNRLGWFVAAQGTQHFFNPSLGESAQAACSKVCRRVSSSSVRANRPAGSGSKCREVSPSLPEASTAAPSEAAAGAFLHPPNAGRQGATVLVSCGKNA